jgi:hypothetical protein
MCVCVRAVEGEQQRARTRACAWATRTGPGGVVGRQRAERRVQRKGIDRLLDFLWCERRYRHIIHRIRVVDLDRRDTHRPGLGPFVPAPARPLGLVPHALDVTVHRRVALAGLGVRVAGHGERRRQEGGEEEEEDRTCIRHGLRGRQATYWLVREFLYVPKVQGFGLYMYKRMVAGVGENHGRRVSFER